MADTFKNVMDKSGPGDRWFLIAPDDDTDMEITPRAIICSAEGNLVAIDAAGTSMTVDMSAGSILPIRPVRVGEATTGTFYGIY